MQQLSILWPTEPPPDDPKAAPPQFFRDLNLDQIVAKIAGAKEEHQFVTGLLCRHLRDVDTVRFRQEVFADLEDQDLLARIRRFADAVGQVRSHIAQMEKMASTHQRQGWFLDAAAIYCDAVRSLADGLRSVHLDSRALSAFRDFLTDYAATPEFGSLASDTRDRKASLAQVRYCVRIRGGRVDVSRYEGQADYSAEVLKIFERFKQGAVKDYLITYRTWPGMDHIGAQIVELVAQLFREEFTALDAFCSHYSGFLHEQIQTFYKEIQFYLSYLGYIEPLRAVGLRFCYPEVTATSKAVFATDTFDLALASKLVSEGKAVVRNEFHLEGSERIFLVSGPNQGGKTTFARTFGQVHHLASVGCPVPGESAKLFLFDQLFTHFEEEEDVTTMTGKLESDLVRMRGILKAATPDTIIILNEIFTSTSLKDARFLGRKVMAKIIQLDLLCVYVSFIDELASVGESVVSMVSTIVPENPAERTYKVVRGPADGLAYALAVAEKHNLTYERLRRRLVP